MGRQSELIHLTIQSGNFLFLDVFLAIKFLQVFSKPAYLKFFGRVFGIVDAIRTGEFREMIADVKSLMIEPSVFKVNKGDFILVRTVDYVS